VPRRNPDLENERQACGRGEAMNYARGMQMVIHDPRLNNPFTTPPTPLRPPAARQTWTVDPARHSAAHIVGWAGVCAQGAPGGRLDAVHFMAHGNRSYVQIGSDGFTAANASIFSALTDRVGVIVFACCLVGSDTQGWYWHHPRYYGQVIADLTHARVVVARENQVYSWNPSNTIDFGDWEGPVDVYGNNVVDSYQEYNPFRTTTRLDLERLIFGS
jgi:hypothetical protein